MLKKTAQIIEGALLRAINVERSLPLQIDITNACNLSCAHCYHPHHRNEGAMSLDDMKSVTRQYLRMCRRLHYKPFFIICGGEPTFSAHFQPLLAFIAAESPDSPIEILTNGTNPAITSMPLVQAALRSNLTFQISLDGADAESHDIVRGSGSFQKTIRNISRLISSGYTVNLLTVLSSRSASSIGKFFELGKSLNVNRVGFTRLIENGQGAALSAKSGERALESEELKSAYGSILLESARNGIKTKLHMPLMHLIHPALGRSGRFWESVVVDYQGYVLASSRSRIRIGHALRDGIEEIFLNSPFMKRLRNGEITTCGSCKHLIRCGGDRNAAYAATGDFFGTDPGCWYAKTKNNKVSQSEEKWQDSIGILNAQFFSA